MLWSGGGGPPESALGRVFPRRSPDLPRAELSFRLRHPQEGVISVFKAEFQTLPIKATASHLRCARARGSVPGAGHLKPHPRRQRPAL